MLTFLYTICLRGVGPGCNSREIGDRLIDLKSELEDLDMRESELDQQRVWVQQSIKNVTEDTHNSPYPYYVPTYSYLHQHLNCYPQPNLR